jgi:hypothetical protein
MPTLKTDWSQPTVNLTYVPGSGMGSVKATDDVYLVYTFTGDEGVVTAVELDIDPGSDIADLLTKNANLRNLTIVADRVIVRMMLRLPSTHVRIYARELDIARGCGIDTSGTPFTTHAVDVYTAGLNGTDGADGAQGGDLTLHIGALRNEGGGPLFELSGAAGQDPGIALPGADGATVTPWNPADANVYWSGLVGTSGRDTLAKIWGKPISDDLWKLAKDVVQIDSTIYDHAHGRHSMTIWTPAGTQLPTDGQPSQAQSGVPGRGGIGGKLFCSRVHIDSSLVHSADGPSGNPRTTPGGKAGYVTCGPNCQAPGSKHNIDVVGTPYILQSKSLPSCKPGADKPGPSAPATKHGTHGGMDYTFLTAPAGWLDPLHLGTYRHFINDLHAAGDFAQALTYVNYVLDALKVWNETSLTAGGPDPLPCDVTFGAAFKSFNALKINLLNRVDPFGNPAGWTPTLSLAVTLAEYDAEVDRALPAFYLARFFDKYASDVTKKKDICTSGIASLQSSRKIAKEQISDLATQAGQLTTDIGTLQTQIRSFQTQLQAAEQALQTQAEFRVYGAHLLKIASAVCSLIPVGQPELGMAGGALNVVTEYVAGKDPTAANAGKDLLNQLSTVASYGLDQYAANLKKELKKDDDDPTAKSSANPNEAKKNARAEKAAALHKLSSGLADCSSSVATELGGMLAPADEIDAMLSQLEAADPEYQRLAAPLRTLNESKAALMSNLTHIVQSISDLTGEIEASYQQESGLYEELVASTQALSPTSWRLFHQMGQDAQQNLLNFQYYLIKAFEYQLLAPVDGVDPRLDNLLTSIDKAVNAGTAPAPGLDYSTYKTALMGIRDTVVGQLADLVLTSKPGRPKVAFTDSLIHFDLSSDELERLNDDQVNNVIINLFDRNQLDPTDENVRIQRIDITIEGKPVPGVGGQNRTCKVKVEHFGDGILRSRCRLYCVRSFAGTPTQSVRWWSATYSENTHPPSAQDQDSPLSNELLAYMIPSQSASKMNNYFYCPPAWSDLKIWRTETWLELTKVHLDITMSVQNADQTEAPLIISEENGWIVPLDLVRLSDNELRQRQTTCFEIYGTGQKVKVMPGYCGPDKMAVALVDLNAPKATDVGGLPPWTLTSMPQRIGRRLQIKLGPAYFTAPLTAPTILAGQASRQVLATLSLSHPYNWPVGGTVAYSLSFVDANKVELQGPWSKELLLTDPGYVFPSLTDIARDPSGTSVRRRVYRRFTDALGKVHPVEQVYIKELDNNDSVASAVDANP